MPRSDLVAVLRRALGLATSGSVPAARVLNPRVLEAAVLLSRLAEPSDVEAWCLVALLHWRRCAELQPGEDQADLRAAIDRTSRLLPILNRLPPDVPPIGSGAAQVIALLAAHADRACLGWAGQAVMLMDQPHFTETITDLDQAAGLLHQAAGITRAANPEALAVFENLGAVHMYRYELCHGEDDLDRAIAAWEAARQRTGVNVPWSLWSNLALGYETRHGLTGAAADLDAAVDMRERSAETADASRRGSELRQLNALLVMRFDAMDRPADIDDAVDVANRAVAASGADRSELLRSWIALVDALGLRFRQSNVLADLDRMISGLRTMLDVADSAEVRAAVLRRLGGGLLVRYERIGCFNDLDDATADLRTAVSLTAAADSARLPECLTKLGDVLRARYARFADPADLAEAIDVGRRALASTPPGDPALGERRTDLCLALRRQFERTSDPADLDEAIELGRAAVDMTPTGDSDLPRRRTALRLALALRAEIGPEGLDRLVAEARDTAAAMAADDHNRAGALSNLAGLILDRCQRTGRDDELDEAVALADQALNVAGDSAERGVFLSTVAATRWARYIALGNRVDLDEAFAAICSAAARVPDNHAALPKVLSGLAGIVAARFDLIGDSALLDEAVDVHRSAADAAPRGSSFHVTVSAQLAEMLRIRSQRTGNADDHVEAVHLYRRAAATSPPGDPRRAEWQIGLAGVLLDWFDRFADATDLDEAIDAARAAVAESRAGGPLRARCCSTLASGLQRRYERTGAPADLTAASEAVRELAALPSADRIEADNRTDLAFNVLAERFTRTGSVADIDLAVDLLRRSVAGAPIDGSTLAARLTSLAGALAGRYERTGASADLDEAVDVCRQALASAAPRSEFHSRSRVQLADILRLRFERDGTWVDLDESADLGRQAAAATTGWPRASALSSLALTLRLRSEHGAPGADLDEAVAVARDAVSGVPPDHPARPGYLSNLGLVLLQRYQHAGRLADLDAATDARREAVSRTPTDHPDHAFYLGNLFQDLLSQFDRRRRPGDLAEALQVIRTCVAATPRDDPRYPGRLHGVAAALLIRFEHTDDRAALDEAVDLQQQVLAATVTADLNRPNRLHALGVMLRVRYLRGGPSGDIDDAVDAARESVTSLAADHPSQAGHHLDLGRTLQTRFLRSYRPTDQQMAYTTFRAGAQVQTAPPVIRVQCAARWAALAADLGQWTEVAAACTVAFAVVPQLVSHDLAFADRRHHLEQIQGLAQLAARAELRRTDTAAAHDVDSDAEDGIDRAWARLEFGRGILISQALDVRPDLTDLRAHDPRLADELDSIQTQLNRGAGAAGHDLAGFEAQAAEPSPLSAARLLALTQSRRDMVQQWERVLATIRSRPGFARFGRPPSLRDLKRAAAHGPIVAISVTHGGTDALVLTEHGGSHLEIPELTHDEAVAQVNRFIAALYPPNGRPVDTSAMFKVLAWLWDVVAEPVLDSLGFTAALAPGQPFPRLWWIPTGALSLLPLHAAGRHGDPGLSVLDRVVSSYSPTVRAMLHTMRPRRSDGTALIVGLNQTNDDTMAALNLAEDEATAVRDLLSTVDSPLLGPHATRAAVASALSTATWVHFACHGIADHRDPAESHLVLFDGRITVAELLEMALPEAWLAYLSACTTATGPERTLDEAIHMAAAFQLAGYAHTIATLWPISDLVAPDLAYHVYSAMATGVGPAQALHDATRILRAAYAGLPELWASHLHFGP